MTGATLTVLVHSSRLHEAWDVILRDPEIAGRAEVHPIEGVAQALARLRTRPPGVVVAAGGDGTINMVVTALWRLEAKSQPLAVLPLGTGNAFAHALGLGSCGVALRTLRAGHERSLDLMVTNRSEPEVAVLSVSTGFESRFLTTWNRLRTRGRFGALLEPARQSLRGPAPRVAITLDGRPLELPPTVWNAGLYNLTHYGFGRRVFPEADPGDGEAEAVVWTSSQAYWRSLVGGVPRGLDSHGVRQGRWRRASLVSDQPIQVDGEAWPAGALELRLESGWLRCLGPVSMSEPTHRTGARRSARPGSEPADPVPRPRA